MEVTYDKEAQAVYIAFSKAPFESNKKVNETTIVDLDKEGNIIGLEMLDVSEQMAKSFLSLKEL